MTCSKISKISFKNDDTYDGFYRSGRKFCAVNSGEDLTMLIFTNCNGRGGQNLPCPGVSFRLYAGPDGRTT